MQNLVTLEELLIAKEGEDLQFKEAKNHISIGEVAKCCCALANGEGKRSQMVFRKPK